MPNVAIYNNQLITPSDIYKFNIDKSTSKFTCFNCDNPLHFRQSRNGDNTNYTEHFYHQNTVKDTHIECEKVTLESLRETNTWHNTISNFIEQENREIIQRNNAIKHIVDAYDHLNNMGIEFQNSQISVEAIKSRDATTHLDWIFNVENQYVCKVEFGNKVVCEIPHDNWEKAVKVVKNLVFLYTGSNEWIYLEDRESYHIEIENRRRNVWIGRLFTFDDVLENTCLQNIITEDGKKYFNSREKTIHSCKIIYARCKKSMYLLDTIHRENVNTHIFQKNDVLAIKSVAGSGKTTTLLNLAKIHKNKRILYLAFNKALIEDIEKKKRSDKINNIYPQTFDSLLYHTYKTVKKVTNLDIINLTPQNISTVIPWFEDKEYKLREYYVTAYDKFCVNTQINNIDEFSESCLNSKRPLLKSLWEKTLRNEFITFNSLRKLSLQKHWFKKYIDENYDMIMIDETQDFDMMMLKMILDDTTIPKIFVGDPMQAIYQFRGCINGFNYMPKHALIVEFYSTFRVGDPACEEIRRRFNNCWMITKSKNNTHIVDSMKGKNYVYLFRTWRYLLQSAQTISDIWIYGFEKKIQMIRKLHLSLSRFGNSINNEEFEDDLPQFLKSITKDTLEELIENIEDNLVEKDKAVCKMYTIHAYKGLEDENVRIANDNVYNGNNIEYDKNIEYVSLTRGKELIMID